MIKGIFEREYINVGRYDEYEILDYLVHEQGFKWAIYGMGENGLLIAKMLKQLYNIEPDFFIDKIKENERTTQKICYSLDDIKGKSFDKLCVVISPCAYRGYCTKNAIDKVLWDVEKKCNKFMAFDGIRITDSFKLDWYYYIKNHIEEFEEIYVNLGDELSKDTMAKFLEIYITGKPYSGITMRERNKYWGIDDNGYTFVKALEDETVLNLGACWGDTIFQFLKLKRNFSKIIGVEGSKQEYQQCMKNIDMLEETFREKIRIDFRMIDNENKIDTCYYNEKITLITMDIEGAELMALQSAKEIIKRDRPVLSICAYHKKEDLLVIPKWIQSVVEDYIFIVRKYPSEFFSLIHKDEFYIDFALQNNELVLYAIPRERYLGKI